MLDDSCDSPEGWNSLLDGDLTKAAPLEETTGLPTVCGICEKPFVDPVILNCLHIFDRECLRGFEKHDNVVAYTKCPRCEVFSGALKSLESYDTSIADNKPDDDKPAANGCTVRCSVCTDGNEALYRCLHCAGTLCERCRGIHKVMKVFSNHEILVLTDEEKKNADVLQQTMKNAKPVMCTSHTDLSYRLFCMQCHVPLCELCLESDHKGHITSSLDLVPSHVKSLLPSMVDACTTKQKELRELTESLHGLLSDLSASRGKNKVRIQETYNQWRIALDRVKDQFMQRNRELHDELEMKIWSRIHALGKIIDHIDFACEFSKTYLMKCSNIELCKLTKNVLACFDSLSKTPSVNDNIPKPRFSPLPCVAHDVVRQQFGSFDLPPPQRSDSVFQPYSRTSPQLASLSAAGDVSGDLKRLSLKADCSVGNGTTVAISNNSVGPLSSVSPTESQGSSRGQNSAMHLQMTSGNGHMDSFITPQSDSGVLTRPITNWSDLSNAMNNMDHPDFLTNVSQVDPSFLGSQFLQPDMNPNALRPLANQVGMSGLDVDSGMLLKQKLPMNYNATLYEYCRIRTARCSQMNLLTKWGSLGCELGRLNSPHGFCLGFDEEIVVADTYNHRIQIFTKRGDFVSFFGVSGRVDGLLWYPRKVAIIRQSQRYVVCDRGNERSRMQLFSRSGHFVRRIPIRYIDIVAGLAINQNGHIVAIDSVSPSVFVVSEEGDLIRWFDCSNHMREPSDVAIHERDYYICDFKAHCVIVFHEDGTFLRRIGGESITDFPNGIDVSDHGDVLVGDSHGNRFHIAVFSRTGDLLSEFVCNQTKVSRSCCLKITTEGYVVTLARSSNNVLVLNTLYIC
ncbi:B-box type zinc finger protein ncl-1 [Fasciola hepatica]|uniref:B-box type zinc finger protein ncl-1 n=1 Tax=Fasciola hepatica TaxID=6192 RepID=A0A4E0QZ67_FASHE|nr:B-box type zinc finger protein ncl-1 [Fasciola hepatica]